MQPLLAHAGITYRRLAVRSEDHAAAVALQAQVWDPATVTPRNNLIAAEHCGGVVLGAFTAAGACVGFTYGFAAFDGTRTWLHSHQTAVSAELRGTGVGATLKWLQRHEALQRGYERVSWTFDPLVARNAAFNLEQLRATAGRYDIDLYGPMADPMNRGLPTDRLWVDWALHGQRASAAFERYRARYGIDDFPGAQPGVCRSTTGIRGQSVTPRVPRPQQVLAGDGRGWPGPPLLDAGAARLLVEIPADVAALKRDDLDAARAWRHAVRGVFMNYLSRGYFATGMMRTSDRRAWYQLTRTEDA